MTLQVVSESGTSQNILRKSPSEPRNYSSKIEFTPVDGQFTCVAPFLLFPPSLSPSPLSIHLPLFLACNPETHHAEQAGPIGCISPLQLPKIRQANAGAPRGRRVAGEVVLLQPEHSLWIHPLSSVYLIFSQLWGAGLATAYKTQSA